MCLFFVLNPPGNLILNLFNDIVYLSLVDSAQISKSNTVVVVVVVVIWLTSVMTMNEVFVWLWTEIEKLMKKLLQTLQTLLWL